MAWSATRAVTITTLHWNQLQREYIHAATKLSVTITGTAAKTYTYEWERAGTGKGEWWGIIPYYTMAKDRR
jgi:hypothetical protein